MNEWNGMNAKLENKSHKVQKEWRDSESLRKRDIVVRGSFLCEQQLNRIRTFRSLFMSSFVFQLFPLQGKVVVGRRIFPYSSSVPLKTKVIAIG